MDEGLRILSANLATKDNLPPALVEAITEHFGAEYPGFEIKFAGDTPQGELPEGMMAELAVEEMNILKSAAYGVCKDCGEKMPCEYPPPDEGEWNTPEGWSMYSNGEPSDENFMFFYVCPACEDATETVVVN